jgi:hypothetical protein
MIMYMCVNGTEFASFYDFSNGCWSCSDSGIFLSFILFFPPSNYIPPTCSVLYITNSQNKLKKCANYLFFILLWVAIRLLCTEVSYNFMNFMMGFLSEEIGFILDFFFGGSVLLFVLFFCAVLCFFVLLVFVLCLVCPKMLVPLDCPFLISTSVFYIAFTVELNFYSLPLNILFYYKLNPLIAWKSYFTIVVVWSQTLKGPPLA